MKSLRKLAVTCIITLFTGLHITAQEIVEISNTLLKEALIKEIYGDESEQEDIFLEDVLNTKYLCIRYTGTSDFSELKHFVNLETLDLRSNQISEMPDLSMLVNLNGLYIHCYKLSEIHNITLIPNLKTLSISFNAITDISEITKMEKLEYLDISGNKIDNMQPISEMVNLKRLEIRSLNLTDISFISELINLERLNIKSNDVADISILQKLIDKGAFSAPGKYLTINIEYNKIYLKDSINISTIDNILKRTDISFDYLDGNLNCTKDEIVQFKDENLEKEISKALYRGVYHKIPIEDAANCDSLNFEINYYKNYKMSRITDLSGMEYFTNLKYLNLYRQEISDITPLQDLTQLKFLDLSATNIVDIEKLKNLNNIEELHFYKNDIEDISVLSDMYNLQILNASSNNIADISPLLNLTNLKTLDLSNNKISSADGLQNLTSLTSLDLYNNLISDIEPLSGLTNLESISLKNNSIENISALSNMTNIDSLWLDYNNIDNMQVLFELSQKGAFNGEHPYLSITYNEIRLKTEVSQRVIEALNEIPNLYFNYFTGNKYCDEDDEIIHFNDKTLERIVVRDLYGSNPKDSINVIFVSDADKVKRIYDDYWSRSISDITGIEHFTNLERISLSYSQIEDISPITNLKKLNYINLQGNQITDISPLLVLYQNGAFDSAGFVNIDANNLYINHPINKPTIDTLSLFALNTDFEFEYLYWNLYLEQISETKVLPQIIHAQHDEISIQTKIEDFNLGVKSVMATIIYDLQNDSVELHDDGKHGDGLEGDKIYGNTWTVPENNMNYSVDIKLTDTNGYEIIESDATMFTSNKRNLPNSIILSEKIDSYDPLNLQDTSLIIFFSEEIDDDSSAIFFIESKDFGKTWNKQKQIQKIPGNTESMSSTMSSDGTIWLFWKSDKETSIKYITSTNSCISWTTPVIFEQASSSVYSMKVISNTNNEMFFYCRFGYNENYAKNSHDNGKNWSKPFYPFVSFSLDFSASFHQNGNLFAIQNSYRENIEIFESNDLGLTWKAHVPILSYLQGDFSSPQLCCTPNNQKFIFAIKEENSSTNITVTTSQEGTSWPDFNNVTNYSGDDDNYKVIIANESPHLFWTSLRDGSLKIWNMRYGTDVDVNLPPEIANIKHEPYSPCATPQDTISIYADVTDETGILHIDALYSLNDTEDTIRVSMARKNGDTYYAEIGPFDAGTVIPYTIEATDVDGNIVKASQFYKARVFDHSWGTPYEPDIKVLNELPGNDALLVIEYTSSDSINYFLTNTTYKEYVKLYTDALHSCGVNYDLWYTFERGVPDSSILNQYTNGAIIWSCFSSVHSILLQEEASEAIRSYCLKHGNIFLTGDIWVDQVLDKLGKDITTQYNYFNFRDSLTTLQTINNDIINDFLSIRLKNSRFAKYKTFHFNNQEAVPIFSYEQDTVGIALDETYKAVFLPVNNYDIVFQNDLNVLIYSVLKWFNPDLIKSEGVYYNSPLKGHNEEKELVMNIFGNRFHENISVELHKQGLNPIIADSLLYQDQKELKVRFNLQGAHIGLYDLVVTDTINNISDTLKGAFEIDKKYMQLSLDIYGRQRIRIGLPSTYKLSLKNKGSFGQTPVMGYLEIPQNMELNEVLKDRAQYATSDSLSSPFYFAFADIKADSAIYLNIKITPQDNTPDTIILKAYTIENLDIIHFINKISNALNVDIPEFSSQFIIDFRTSYKTSEDEIRTEWNNIVSSGNSDFEYNTCKKFLVQTIELSFEKMDKNSSVKDEAQEIYKSWEEIQAMSDFNEQLVHNATMPLIHTEAKLRVSPAVSIDPNEKVASVGVGEQGYIWDNEQLVYTIFFENKKDATIAAGNIQIIDTLSTYFDLDSILLKQIQIGEIAFPMNDIITDYHKRFHLNDENDIQIDISINKSTRVLTFNLQAVDLEFGDMGNLLPPNITSPEGEGYVKFHISPKKGLSSGTVLSNSASIIFDVNEPILTNTVVNTIDAEIPLSTLLSIEHTEQFINENPEFEIKWEAKDELNGSGIKGIQIFYSVNSGPYQLLQEQITYTNDRISLENGYIYQFIITSTDSVNHIEPFSELPDLTLDLINNPIRNESISIDEQQLPNIKVFPNPTVETLYVTVENSNTNKKVIEIYTLKGNLIAKKELTTTNFTEKIDVSSLNNGLYFIAFKSKSYSAIKYFVKE